MAKVLLRVKTMLMRQLFSWKKCFSCQLAKTCTRQKPQLSMDCYQWTLNSFLL